MRPSRLLVQAAIICLPVMAWAQGGVVADISHRDDCSPAAYRDPAYTLVQLFDTTALQVAFLEFQKPPADWASVMIRFLPSGTVLSVDVASNSHTAKENSQFSNRIRSLIQRPPFPADTAPLMLTMGMGPQGAMELRSGEVTCSAATLDVSAIGKDFEHSIKALRREGAIPTSAHGRVVVQFTVGPTGAVERPHIVSGSPWSATDSAAVRAIYLGKFLPEVIGKYGVPTLSQQAFSF